MYTIYYIAFDHHHHLDHDDDAPSAKMLCSMMIMIRSIIPLQTTFYNDSSSFLQISHAQSPPYQQKVK